MIKLKTVVQQLTEEHYQGLVSQFQKSRAEKFSSLLKYLRESELDEDEVPEKLSLNKTAYYTLKSRLYEKIQEFLFENVQDPRIELLSNVANIHNLIYNTPKDTAIAILKKLEKELAEYDMPNELISVYNALKKLHLSSPKYYEYAQLYNKHVAYTIALDKAEDLLSRFVKTLGDFLISRDPATIEILTLMKAEMANVFRLYESHHLAIYRNILNISFALYIPGYQPAEDEMTVEEMLNASTKIFDDNVRDAHYKFLRSVFDFLAFEYYHGLKLYKNEAPFFEKINARLDAFMLADHCCFNARFLISKVERYSYLGITEKLEAESDSMITEISKEDTAGYVYWKMFKACAYFYSQKYSEAAKCLNDALNDVSFKNMLFAEVEVKLFLALNYSMVNKYEQAEILIKSISRKLNEKEEENCENVQSFIRMLKLQMSSGTKGVEDKIKKLRDKFLQQNEGRNKILSFLKMDDAFIAELSRSIKRVNA
ncbi:MAG TPA: hypothetical protein VGO45_08130 [Bacteroidia bacterium]|jgi:hypothetical protein|nr:hypothetical protein [Bacteroidia bacterium]